MGRKAADLKCLRTVAQVFTKEMFWEQMVTIGPVGHKPTPLMADRMCRRSDLESALFLMVLR